MTDIWAVCRDQSRGVEAGCRIGQLRESLGLPFLFGDVPQAFLEPGHLAEPLHLVGFVESFPGVRLNLEEARYLGVVHAQHGAAQAGMLVLARCAVGSFAGAQRHLPEAEMVTEFLPLGVGRFAVFEGGAPGASLIDVAAVLVDDCRLPGGWDHLIARGMGPLWRVIEDARWGGLGQVRRCGCVGGRTVLRRPGCGLRQSVGRWLIGLAACRRSW